MLYTALRTDDYSFILFLVLCLILVFVLEKGLKSKSKSKSKSKCNKRWRRVVRVVWADGCVGRWVDRHATSHLEVLPALLCDVFVNHAHDVGVAGLLGHHLGRAPVLSVRVGGHEF